MNVLGAILGIKVSLDGSERVIRGLKDFRNELNLNEAALKTVRSGMKGLAAEAGIVVAALALAGSDESMRLQLEAITHSGATAAAQMNLIRNEFEKGIFDKQEIFQAIKFFDETKSSIRELLPLSEELANRTGGGLAGAARALASLSGGGIARLGALLRNAGLSIRELRSAGLNITDSYQIRSNPAQTLNALKTALGSGSLSNALTGGLSAEIKGVAASMKELFRSMGDGLAPVIKPALEVLRGLLKTLTFLNDMTHGWLSNILLAVWALKSIRAVLPLFEALVNYEKLAAFWAGILKILNDPWGSIAQAIGAVVTALKGLANAEKLAAAWAAILDALDGNYVALATGAAVAAAVGVAWVTANKSDNGSGSEPSAERPVRRSDVENAMSGARGRAYA